jgi:cellobiose-specific phosphotransferase system component IIB
VALRFRKSVKILPGVRVNFGLKDTSLSVRDKDVSVSIIKQTTYGNVSIRGIEISFREKISNNSRNEKAIKQ